MKRIVFGAPPPWCGARRELHGRVEHALCRWLAVSNGSQPEGRCDTRLASLRAVARAPVKSLTRTFVIRLKLIALRLAAIAADGAHIQHARAELDERAALDWDIKSRQVR